MTLVKDHQVDVRNTQPVAARTQEPTASGHVRRHPQPVDQYQDLGSPGGPVVPLAQILRRRR